MVPSQLRPLILVLLGGVLGAATRYGVLQLLSADWWPSLILNVIGSLLVGWLLGRRLDSNVPIWLLASIGFSGGLTTFSGFALDVAERLDQSLWLEALLVTVSSVVLAVVAGGVGYQIGRR